MSLKPPFFFSSSSFIAPRWQIDVWDWFSYKGCSQTFTRSLTPCSCGYIWLTESLVWRDDYWQYVNGIKPFDYVLHPTPLAHHVHYWSNCWGHKPLTHILIVQSVLIYAAGHPTEIDKKKMGRLLFFFFLNLTCASWYQLFHFWGCPVARRDFACRKDQGGKWLLRSKETRSCLFFSFLSPVMFQHINIYYPHLFFRLFPRAPTFDTNSHLIQMQY